MIQLKSGDFVRHPIDYHPEIEQDILLRRVRKIQEIERRFHEDGGCYLFREGRYSVILEGLCITVDVNGVEVRRESLFGPKVPVSMALSCPGVTHEDLNELQDPPRRVASEEQFQDPSASFLEACVNRGVEEWSPRLWACFLASDPVDVEREWSPGDLPSLAGCRFRFGLADALWVALPALEARTRSIL